MAPVVTLREVELGDLPAFYKNQEDELAVRMAAWPPREHDAFDAHWVRILAKNAARTRTILADGKVAGNVAVFAIQDETHLGYSIGRAFWGKGIAGAAVAQFLASLPPQEIHADVAQHNAASLRILLKNGFVVTGEQLKKAPDRKPVTILRLRRPAAP